MVGVVSEEEYAPPNYTRRQTGQMSQYSNFSQEQERNLLKSTAEVKKPSTIRRQKENMVSQFLPSSGNDVASTNGQNSSAEDIRVQVVDNTDCGSAPLCNNSSYAIAIKERPDQSMPILNQINRNTNNCRKNSVPQSNNILPQQHQHQHHVPSVLINYKDWSRRSLSNDGVGVGGDNSPGNVNYQSAPNADTEDDNIKHDLKPADVAEEKFDIYRLNGNVVTIDVPSCSSESNDFPQERMKTFIAFIILFCSFFITTVSLAIVHDRVPNRKVYKPLPDTFLDSVDARDWALSVSEGFIMITSHITMVIVILHKHRFIVLRRVCLILSLLYCMRSITMFVTVLPVSSVSYTCSEQLGHPTVSVILIRALQLFSGLGLTINGQHTYCGDYIYSGHTTILVVSYLMICEYSPRRFFLLHWCAWIMSFVGVVMVLVSHGHYTVDVIIAYYVTTRLFWLYHTLANNSFLKQESPNNYLAREWWFPLFKYFEGNINGPVPLEYNFPLPWPFSCPRSYQCSRP